MLKILKWYAHFKNVKQHKKNEKFLMEMRKLEMYAVEKKQNICMHHRNFMCFFLDFRFLMISLGLLFSLVSIENARMEER